MKQLTARECLDSLRGLTCPACAGKKWADKSLCPSCYYMLPKYRRDALYRLIGNGYERAITEAIIYLRKKRGRDGEEMHVRGMQDGSDEAAGGSEGSEVGGSLFGP